MRAEGHWTLEFKEAFPFEFSPKIRMPFNCKTAILQVFHETRFSLKGKSNIVKLYLWLHAPHVRTRWCSQPNGYPFFSWPSSLSSGYSVGPFCQEHPRTAGGVCQQSSPPFSQSFHNCMTYYWESDFISLDRGLPNEQGICAPRPVPGIKARDDLQSNIICAPAYHFESHSRTPLSK